VGSPEETGGGRDIVIVHDCRQRSEEWHALRAPLLTASCADAILAVRQRGSGELKVRASLRRQIVAARLTGMPQDDGYQSIHMRHGEDCEDTAFATYEAIFGLRVQRIGFIQHDTLAAGCSPDGIVGNWHGGLELKCPKSTTHLDYLLAGELPEEYRGQVIHNLWITGLPWWDFVSFDDRFEDGLDLVRVRVERDEAQIASYELLVRQFLAEVDAEVDRIRARVAVVAVA
jgi:hypothetical protein